VAGNIKHITGNQLFLHFYLKQLNVFHRNYFITALLDSGVERIRLKRRFCKQNKKNSKLGTSHKHGLLTGSAGGPQGLRNREESNRVSHPMTQPTRGFDSVVNYSSNETEAKFC